MLAFLYIMLARPARSFFTVLRMNFPVMLIAEDICGLRLGLCRYADIGIGLAPLVCRAGSVWIFQIRFGFQSQVLGFGFLRFRYLHTTTMQEYPNV